MVLLGIPPNRPEVEYGWIEPAQRLSGSATDAVYAVRAFWEKPARAVSEDLRALGALWNSFVLVGERTAFERLIAAATPALSRAFQPLATIGDPERVRATRRELEWSAVTA